MRNALQPIIDKVWRHCEATGTRGRTVTLKVKYADFRQITRRLSATAAMASRQDLEARALRLLDDMPNDPRGVRLLGVTLSALLDQVSSSTATVDPQFALPL